MKVLILGAGPAGCASAYYLKRQGFSDITIVERSAVGGNAHTSFYEGIPYEFGPQIMYTDEDRLREVFEVFLQQHAAPTHDGRYYPALSVDGTLKRGSVHSFPVTISNVLQLPEPEKVIDELYRVNLDKPDYSNFEAYVISRMGETLYNTYVKNYNIKQWKVHPSEMDAEWARFRNLTLRVSGSMFGDKWQGHPGSYNPMWEGMLEGVKVIYGSAEVADDLSSVAVDGERIDADLVISSLPLSNRLDFINTCKVYIGIDDGEFLMPSYTTSFPNSYDFVRILEYKQQFYVDSPYALLDFAFPWIGQPTEQEYIEQAKLFVEEELKREVRDLWVDSRETVYPVSTKENLELVEHRLDMMSKSNIIPVGRCGVHAYVSKDTCIRMALIMVENLEALLGGDPVAKRGILGKMREKLT